MGSTGNSAEFGLKYRVRALGSGSTHSIFLGVIPLPPIQCLNLSTSNLIHLQGFLCEARKEEKL